MTLADLLNVNVNENELCVIRFRNGNPAIVAAIADIDTGDDLDNEPAVVTNDGRVFFAEDILSIEGAEGDTKGD